MYLLNDYQANKVDKKAMIRNGYNLIPHPAPNTKREKESTIKTALK